MGRKTSFNPRLSFSNTFLQEVLPSAGLEELLMGLASQISEREDSVLCSDVRGKWHVARSHFIRNFYLTLKYPSWSFILLITVF